MSQRPPVPSAILAVRKLVDADLDVFFTEPHLLDEPSAWFGHTPFARWIIRAVQPAVFVELGTHAGVSYSAFCMEIKASGLGTQGFAIDTWEGDDQAGRYPESVFENFKEFHAGNFSEFSTLLRSSFDEALPGFADGSIDLLHIDGLHTYEAVSHDFNSWHSKLSDRAVVLFHDIAERKNGFGVWKLWDELKDRYPHFDFAHEHGLGVLAVGGSAPRDVLDLCRLEAPLASKVRERFEQLGDRWRIQSENSRYQAVLKKEIDAGRSEITVDKLRSDQFDARLLAFKNEIASLEQRVADLQARLMS
ncbi:class I SAM-dependent methyltransferase [Kaistia terrae]|uniref:Class I SAM-dependent methyltransferase n=1 Tax=Kaistia terrae TaxID=537017 RepID=A0ABW0PU98_9HYPH|nr:class I SAM-dependent methyltransferase [Kaistia terrae]MCX5577041.1 class I SAM-dependent methyltransferase [Kaistia terrae]